MKHLSKFVEYLCESESTYDKFEVRYELKKYPMYDPIEIYTFDNLKDAEIQYIKNEYSDDKLKSDTHTKTLAKITYKNNEIFDLEIIKSIDYNINQDSNNLLEHVEEWFSEKYGSTASKYHSIIIKNPIDESETKYLQVRIANHSENINNIDRFGRPDYNLSIIISDFDVTRNKFGNDGEGLIFNTDYDIESIKDEITAKIENIKIDIENSF